MPTSLSAPDALDAMAKYFGPQILVGSGVTLEQLVLRRLQDCHCLELEELADPCRYCLNSNESWNWAMAQVVPGALTNGELSQFLLYLRTCC